MRWKAFIKNRAILCCVCQKDLGSGPMGHCSRCSTNSCPDCDINYYKCDGFHDFGEYACTNCIPEYGKIVNDTYYCPRCCPNNNSDEYRFKRDFYCFQESIVQKELQKRIEEGKGFSYSSYHMDDDELNNPENWRLHRRKPHILKNKITRFFQNQFKPKRKWIPKI